LQDNSDFAIAFSFPSIQVDSFLDTGALTNMNQMLDTIVNFPVPQNVIANGVALFVAVQSYFAIISSSVNAATVSASDIMFSVLSERHAYWSSQAFSMLNLFEVTDTKKTCADSNADVNNNCHGKEHAHLSTMEHDSDNSILSEIANNSFYSRMDILQFPTDNLQSKHSVDINSMDSALVDCEDQQRQVDQSLNECSLFIDGIQQSLSECIASRKFELAMCESAKESAIKNAEAEISASARERLAERQLEHEIFSQTTSALNNELMEQRLQGEILKQELHQQRLQQLKQQAIHTELSAKNRKYAFALQSKKREIKFAKTAFTNAKLHHISLLSSRLSNAERQTQNALSDMSHIVQHQLEIEAEATRTAVALAELSKQHTWYTTAVSMAVLAFADVLLLRYSMSRTSTFSGIIAVCAWLLASSASYALNHVVLMTLCTCNMIICAVILSKPSTSLASSYSFYTNASDGI
jgi:hypothetical protein